MSQYQPPVSTSKKEIPLTQNLQDLLNNLIENPVQVSKVVVGELKEHFATLTPPAIALAEQLPELKKYFLNGVTLEPGTQIQTDLPSNAGEFMRTMGALEVIALQLKAAKGDNDLDEAYELFNQNIPAENRADKVAFLKHSQKLAEAVAVNDDALPALVASVVLSDLAKSEIFRNEAQQQGLSYIDADHDVVMEHLLEAFSDDQIGALAPTFAGLSKESKILVRSMFIIELNPGWITQGEASPSQIENYLHPASAIENSYLAPSLDDGLGRIDTSHVKTAQVLLRTGLFFSDIAGTRRQSTDIGTVIFNKPVFDNFSATFNLLDDDSMTVEDCFKSIVQGQAIRNGVIEEGQTLTSKEFAFTRASQLLRLKQLGISSELLHKAFNEITSDQQLIIEENLGASQERSFTVTYLPGIFGEIMKYANTDQEKQAVMKGCLLKLAEIYQTLHRDVPEERKGALRVDGRPVKFNQGITKANGLESALSALAGIPLAVKVPEHPKGTMSIS